MTREAVVEGARFVFDGAVTASQRIPGERRVVRLHAGRTDWRSDGDRRLVAGHLVADVRDDAVLVLRATRPASIGVELLFAPEHDESVGGRRLALDPTGGVGLFPTRAVGGGRRPVARYDLAPGDELYASVCPPRAPSPLREREEIAHEGRPRPFPAGAYPSREILEDAARHCRVLALHAYVWDAGPRRVDPSAGRYMFRRRPWTTARHAPSHPDLFARVADDTRRLGMKLVVYMSPRHSKAPSFADEMRRVLDTHAVDGLYLDGLSDDFRTDDAIVAAARAVLGPDRILYLHAENGPFGAVGVRCPFTEARADYVLRGSAGRGGLPLDRFLRYGVSGRNVSNAVGLWCHYGSSGRIVPADRAPSARHIDAARAEGVRLWRRSAWGAGLAAFDRRYYGAG